MFACKFPCFKNLLACTIIGDAILRDEMRFLYLLPVFLAHRGPRMSLFCMTCVNLSDLKKRVAEAALTLTCRGSSGVLFSLKTVFFGAK